MCTGRDDLVAELYRRKRLDEAEVHRLGRVADQAALQGLLAKIWDLGLSLLSVQQKKARGDDH